MGSKEVVPSNSSNNSATIGLGSQHPNGLYHCSSGQSQREYFSLFSSTSGTNTTKLCDMYCMPTYWQVGRHFIRLNLYKLVAYYNCTCLTTSRSLLYTVTLPTPIVQNNSTVWTLTSPEGSRVERYIVEFQCRVRSITFVEKYMSVSASGGTGRVATNVSCFGGLGQLYRVKVWAVSGPSISPALDCATDGQCREEGGRRTGTTMYTHVHSAHVHNCINYMRRTICCASS